MTPNIFFSGNRRLDHGVEFHRLLDRPTNRQDVPSIVMGPKPRNGRPARFAKVIPQKANDGKGGDNKPIFRGDKIIRASVVEDVVDGKKRFVLSSDLEEKGDVIVAKTGLDAEDGSTENHRQRLENEGVTLKPHGVVSLDGETIRLLLADTVNLDELMKDPNFVMGRGAAQRLGPVESIGKLIPSIRCADSSWETWRVGRGGVLLKGMITGEIHIIRRVGGEVVERTVTDPTTTKLFYDLWEKDRELRTRAARAAKVQPGT